VQSDIDPLQEGDWLDQTSEIATPAQPMVVIHYRNRGVPFWVLILLILVIPIGGILVYHRFFVEADRADAVEARRALQDKIAGKRLDAPIPVAVEPSATLASNAQSIVSKSTLTTTTAQRSPSSPSPAANGDRAEATSKESPFTQPKPDAPVLAQASPSPDSDPLAKSVASAAGQSQVRSAIPDPVVTGRKSAAPPAMVTDPITEDGTALEAVKNRSTRTKDESKKPVAHGPDNVAASEPPPARNDQQVPPTPEPQTDDASRLVVAAESAPILSKPESVRQGQEAAAKKLAEIDSRVLGERVKFRQALKDALSLNIIQAGTEIDGLCRRDGQDRDPERFAQARKAWFSTRVSSQAKVRLIRSLGLPESVILDFISADLDRLIGSRSGPRDLNDVRVRAAKILLTHELPAPTSTIAASGRPSPPERDEPTTTAKARSGGAWPFRPERDAFRSNALLDLRSLNEKIAGQSGFVRLAPDGESFVLGDGTPIRFWGVAIDQKHDRIVNDSAHHARFLAKRGVNMVRWYQELHSQAKNSRITDTDARSIDATWKFVAAMKQQGIYVTICPYWSASVKPVPSQWDLEGWPAKESPWGLLFFNPGFQQGYKAWLKSLLARPNPYTGIPLANDPAVAVIQLQNEDSLLFYTSQQIVGKQAELLGRQFADWLKIKYGTLVDAFRAWDNDTVKEDRVAQGIVGLLLVWEWTQPRQGGRKKRLDDQLQFYAETMYRFNREIGRYLHEELGCKMLVNAGNWKSVDAVKVDAAERWSYTANEVMAVNRYYAPIHLGPNRGWRIDAGDTFEDASILLHPRELPLNLKQSDGHPMMITESHWVPPLGYQAEGPFLVAAYQSLNGVDVVDWYGTAEPEWSDQDRNLASQYKWSIATPMVLGQFPAAALLFRKGYLQQGQPVVEEHRSLKQIWERVPPLIAEDPSYDPNRDLGDSARRSGQDGNVDPLAFLVGPVKVKYDSDPAKTKVADLGGFIDHDRKVVRGNTGQVRLDYGRGLCTIDAPQAQGACGFLQNIGPVELSSVSLRSENHYASVLIVSMDGEILSKSKRVLVQVGTRARPTGWVERETTLTAGNDKHTVIRKRVVSTGHMPWAVENTNMTLEVKNPGLTRATSLDLNGNARGPVKVADSGGALKLNLPPDAMYVILESE
jgi:hypothetical protein